MRVMRIEPCAGPGKEVDRLQLAFGRNVEIMLVTPSSIIRNCRSPLYPPGQAGKY